MGRKAIEDKKITFTVRLRQDLIDWLKSTGNANSYIESVLQSQREIEQKKEQMLRNNLSKLE
jgi:hypothetical protein